MSPTCRLSRPRRLGGFRFPMKVVVLLFLCAAAGLLPTLEGYMCCWEAGARRAVEFRDMGLCLKT